MQKLKMDRLKLNDNKKLPWRFIEDINWNYLSKTFPNQPYDKVGEYCKQHYTLNEVILLHNFIVEKRQNLQDNLRQYIKGCGDDSFWDLCSHIVGLGESTYDLCLKHPEIAQVMADNKEYVENFEYGFTKATYDLQEINDNCSVSC